MADPDLVAAMSGPDLGIALQMMQDVSGATMRLHADNATLVNIVTKLGNIFSAAPPLRPGELPPPPPPAAAGTAGTANSGGMYHPSALGPALPPGDRHGEPLSPHRMHEPPGPRPPYGDPSGVPLLFWRDNKAPPSSAVTGTNAHATPTPPASFDPHTAGPLVRCPDCDQDFASLADGEECKQGVWYCFGCWDGDGDAVAEVGQAVEAADAASAAAFRANVEGKLRKMLEQNGCKTLSDEIRALEAAITTMVEQKHAPSRSIVQSMIEDRKVLASEQRQTAVSPTAAGNTERCGDAEQLAAVAASRVFLTWA